MSEHTILSKSVMVDVGDDLEIVEGSELHAHFADVRFELACLGGHNLVLNINIKLLIKST